jgi:DNA polymerase-4
MHADMDAFFAAVEQLDRPELRGKPVLIGHPSPRSVVSTASYEARCFGVGSAMPMATARRRCPDGIIVPPRFDRYLEYSRMIMKVFHDFSPLVEALGLDEAFIDLTGTEKLWGPPQEVGEKVKAAILEATGGLKVSVGISSTKYVAKVASDHDKPNGLTIVPPTEVKAFLWPQSIASIWGVGKLGRKRLSQLGLRTIRDVAQSDPVWLKQSLGSLGDHIYQLCHGIDPRPVITEHDVKSVGAEFTLAKDISGESAIRPHLFRAAEQIAPSLRKKHLVAKGIRVKLKTTGFKIITRQIAMTRPSSNAKSLYQAGCELLDRFDLEQDFRLVGMAAFDLHTPIENVQFDLFEDPGSEKERDRNRLDQEIDNIRSKFGKDALKPASEL